MTFATGLSGFSARSPPLKPCGKRKPPRSKVATNGFDARHPQTSSTHSTIRLTIAHTRARPGWDSSAAKFNCLLLPLDATPPSAPQSSVPSCRWFRPSTTRSQPTTSFQRRSEIENNPHDATSFRARSRVFWEARRPGGAVARVRCIQSEGKPERSRAISREVRLPSPHLPERGVRRPTCRGSDVPCICR